MNFNRFIYLLLEALAGTFLDWNRNLNSRAKKICKHTKTKSAFVETLTYEYTAIRKCADCGVEIARDLTDKEKTDLYMDRFNLKEIEYDDNYTSLIQGGGFNL